MFMDVQKSALHGKVKQICFGQEQKAQFHSLVEDFWCMFDGHLGHKSMAEHMIETSGTKPVNLPPYHTSLRKKQIIESQIKQILEEGIIETGRDHKETFWRTPILCGLKGSKSAHTERFISSTPGG